MNHYVIFYILCSIGVSVSVITNEPLLMLFSTTSAFLCLIHEAKSVIIKLDKETEHERMVKYYRDLLHKELFKNEVSNSK